MLKKKECRERGHHYQTGTACLGQLVLTLVRTNFCGCSVTHRPVRVELLTCSVCHRQKRTISMPNKMDWHIPEKIHLFYDIIGWWLVVAFTRCIYYQKRQRNELIQFAVSVMSQLQLFIYLFSFLILGIMWLPEMSTNGDLLTTPLPSHYFSSS